jgi:hypothetical protein
MGDWVGSRGNSDALARSEAEVSVDLLGTIRVGQSRATSAMGLRGIRVGQSITDYGRRGARAVDPRSA